GPEFLRGVGEIVCERQALIAHAVEGLVLADDVALFRVVLRLPLRPGCRDSPRLPDRDCHAVHDAVPGSGPAGDLACSPGLALEQVLRLLGERLLAVALRPHDLRPGDKAGVVARHAGDVALQGEPGVIDVAALLGYAGERGSDEVPDTVLDAPHVPRRTLLEESVSKSLSNVEVFGDRDPVEPLTDPGLEFLLQPAGFEINPVPEGIGPRFGGDREKVLSDRDLVEDRVEVHDGARAVLAPLRRERLFDRRAERG